MDERTDGRESLGLRRLRRETNKNVSFLHSLRLASMKKPGNSNDRFMKEMQIIIIIVFPMNT